MVSPASKRKLLFHSQTSKDKCLEVMEQTISLRKVVNMHCMKREHAALPFQQFSECILLGVCCCRVLVGAKNAPYSFDLTRL